jgi:exopolysaccharide biosynthesis polyprenyl glycosylphosphotransferase
VPPLQSVNESLSPAVAPPASAGPAAERAPSPGAPTRAFRLLRTGLTGDHSQVVIDIMMLAVASVAAELASPQAGVQHTPWPWVLAFPLLVVLLLRIRGLYYPRLFPSTLDQVRAVVVTTSIAAMTILSLRVLLTDDVWVAAQTARFWVFASAYLVAVRLFLAWSLHLSRLRGELLRPTLIIGAGRVGRLTARRLAQSPDLGLKPIGFLDKDPLEDPGEDDLGLPVLGASWDLDRVVLEHGVKHVIVTFSTAPTPIILRLMGRCEALGVAVSFVPRLFERVGSRISVEHLGGIPLVAAQPTDPHGWQFSVKYTVDRVMAIVLIVLCAPVLLAAAVATWISVRRPILFRQERVGMDGRPFTMLKFRTMRDPDDSFKSFQLAVGLAPGGVEGEDRRTRVGTFLRRTCIDELPQLLNVLKGEMSLVGPRPERPEFAFAFQERVYRYGERLRVKSGISGWAQVNGLRGKTSLADRVEWDNYYIENWSLWLDLKILLLTVVAVFSMRAE